MGSRTNNFGMSKEADCVVVIVSEESGKISVAKEGRLLIDVEEDTLRQINEECKLIYEKKLEVFNIIENKKVKEKEKKVKLKYQLLDKTEDQEKFKKRRCRE